MYNSSNSSESSSNVIVSTKSERIETVQIHSSEPITLKTTIPPPPIPLPRKKLFTENLKNSTETFCKESKQQQNESTKLRLDEILKEDSVKQTFVKDTLTSSSSSSTRSTPKQSSNYFAENRNDTIVSNPDSEKSSQQNGNKSSESTKENEKIIVRKYRRKSRSKVSVPSDSSSSSSSSSSVTEPSTSASLKYSKKRKIRKRKNSKEDKLKKITKYSYEKIIGIFLHRTSELRYDAMLKEPRLRISICDLETKKYLGKSDVKRSVVSFNEPEYVDYIQSVITKAGKFVDPSPLITEWEELILINEDINHLHSEKIIIFFELIDIIPISSKLFNSPEPPFNQNGWYHIAWAFLKVYPLNKFSNLNQRLRLQFYEYQKKKSSAIENLRIFEQYSSIKKHKKYPGTLEITIKGIKPMKMLDKDKQIKMRPINALEEEYLEKSLPGSDQPLNSTKPQRNNFLATTKSLWTVTNRWKKLPGQAYKSPNRLMKKVVEHRNGSYVSKFSKSGYFLAYTYMTEEKLFNINILDFPNLNKIITLSGHTNNIYELDWMESKQKSPSFPIHLVSSSSDRTSIFWTIFDRNKFNYKILPHPSFVYTSKFLLVYKLSKIVSQTNKIRIVTGGRDGIIRLWKYEIENLENQKMENNDKIFTLENELKYHNDTNGYVTSILCHENGEYFYSSDSNGEIVEWKLKVKNFNVNGVVTRKFQLNTDIITSMILHPRGRKIFYNANQTKNIISVLDIESFDILKQYPENISSTLSPSKFTISPCGTYFFYTIQSSGDIQIINLLTGKSENVLKTAFLFNQKNFVSSIDFHLKDSFFCLSVYGMNGGIAVYENHMDINTNITTENYLKNLNLEQFEFRDTEKLFQNNLQQIIERIDNVFFSSKKTENLNKMEEIAKYTKKDFDSWDYDSKLTDSSKSSVVKSSNRTFVVEKVSEDELRREGNHEEDSRKDDFENQTYSISKSISIDMNTYDIQKSSKTQNCDSDGTSISESLD